MVLSNESMKHTKQMRFEERERERERAICYIVIKKGSLKNTCLSPYVTLQVLIVIVNTTSYYKHVLWISQYMLSSKWGLSNWYQKKKFFIVDWFLDQGYHEWIVSNDKGVWTNKIEVCIYHKKLKNHDNIINKIIFNKTIEMLK